MRDNDTRSNNGRGAVRLENDRICVFERDGIYQARIRTETNRYLWLCVPKTLSALISRRNHLTSVDHVRTVLLRPGRFGLAIQVEEPT
jgi:hypothetical protein